MVRRSEWGQRRRLLRSLVEGVTYLTGTRRRKNLAVEDEMTFWAYFLLS